MIGSATILLLKIGSIPILFGSGPKVIFSDAFLSNRSSWEFVICDWKFSSPITSSKIMVMVTDFFRNTLTKILSLKLIVV